MKYCKVCVMSDKRPGIKFNEDGICYPCLSKINKKNINWNERYQELVKICDKYKRKNGEYDCILPASGGKDSHYQAHILKKLGMNPLLVCVSDSFTHTKEGQHNLYLLSERYGIDTLVYNLNHKTVKKMMRIAFEEYGMPNWPIDLAIYSIPLKIAHSLGIKLIIYGENISYEYGGPECEETYSAKKQIMNNAVTPINNKFWYDRGIGKKEIDFIQYPTEEIVKDLEPIYLSYFVPWSGYENYKFTKEYGFSDLGWHREGYIEDYDQIDSIGYLLHPWLKFIKYGHARTTDVACNLIRQGLMNREEAVRLVLSEDYKIDEKILDDFLKTTGYSEEEFWSIIDSLSNRDIVTKTKDGWRLKRNVRDALIKGGEVEL